MSSWRNAYGIRLSRKYISNTYVLNNLNLIINIHTHIEKSPEVNITACRVAFYGTTLELVLFSLQMSG